MPTSLIFAVQQTRTFNQRINSISVSTGSLVVTVGEEEPDTFTVDESNSPYDVGDRAGLSVYSPGGSSASFTYSNEPEFSVEAQEAAEKMASRKAAKSKSKSKSKAKSSTSKSSTKAKSKATAKSKSKSRGK